MQGQNYIAGQFLPGRDKRPVENPATQKIIGEMAQGTSAEVDAAVQSAKDAQRDWAKKAPIERAGYLHEIAALVRDRAEEIAVCISREQGKTMDLARGEVEFAHTYFDYNAEWARRLEGEIISSDRPGEQIFLTRKPIGVVAGILPWNFPFFLIARKMAPALLTGNTIVIKPSTLTPLNAHLFAQLVEESSLPKGVFNMVAGGGTEVGNALAGHPNVGLVSVTGSVATGAKIMEAASRNITKVNLELGGNAPVLVLNDADVDKSVEAVVASRVINAGQVCNCAERVYVERVVADEFEDKLAERMDAVKFGDPIAADQAGDALEMGPMVEGGARDAVHAKVTAAISDGAELRCGGSAPESDGHFYKPTVLTGCTEDMSVMKDEIFGPVLPVRRVDDLDQAIALANDSQFGLTSSVFSNNINAVLKACEELNFGETYVNREHMEAIQGFHAGVRKSGIGGADGKHGLYEFTETHIVYMQRGQ